MERLPVSLTYDNDELIAKQNAKWLILYAIILAIGLIEFVLDYHGARTQLYSRSHFLVFLIALFLIGSSIYLWYLIFDGRTKLIINKKGLWSEKSKFLPWERILFYSFEKRSGKITTYTLKIETQNPGHDYFVNITYLDKSFSEIKNAIDLNAAGTKIEYLGLSEK